ncbi:MAG: efflux RND transporter periplasmic adaptor subunit, partial [Caulobacteraceae bacterium]
AMLARPGGRYEPVEVKVGREAGGRSEILAGLNAGDQVVASGQFLIDSEASLSDLQPRPLPTGTTRADAPSTPASVMAGPPLSSMSGMTMSKGTKP